jgi:hypothetical protein
MIAAVGHMLVVTGAAPDALSLGADPSAILQAATLVAV